MAKKKEIKLHMKFNPALQKYEPVLPPLKIKGKEVKFKDVWQVIPLIILILVIAAIFLILQNEEPEQGDYYCEVDSDCVVFGEDGDCNCGCYNKEALPKDSGGKCFCAAPTSCACLNETCEGVFE